MSAVPANAVRVLLCGEGAHDVGAREWVKAAEDWVFSEGWLQPTIRNLSGKDLCFEAEYRAKIILLPRDKAKHRPLPKGHGARALASCYVASMRECAVVVFMADNDSNDKNVWQEHISQIENGFSKFEGEVTGIACVPMGTSESWLLADSNAWMEVSGLEIETPKCPESLWGTRTDPAADHPKHVFARTCSETGQPDGRETRRAIAAASRPQTVAESCPISYGHFQTKVSEAL